MRLITYITVIAAVITATATASFGTVEQRPFVPSIRMSAAKGEIPVILSSGRDLLLHVPEGYEDGIEHPLVLSFHGAGGNSYRQQRLTQLSDPSLRIADLPFLVAYPQGVNNTDWNMTHIWQSAPYGNSSVDDVQFAKDIVTYISSIYTIDRTRLYVNGKSNGGGFTSYLACRADTSLLFAAFAPVSPALYQEGNAFHGCEPSRAVPILHSHGYQDPVTLFYGRKKSEHWRFGSEPDVRIWRARWAKRNGCQSSSSHASDKSGKLPKPTKIYHPHDNVTEEVWDCGHAPIHALSIEGLGHAWPSTEGLDQAGKPLNVATFNFTAQHLLDFYTANPLPRKYLP